jgi:hypothetical protein
MVLRQVIVAGTFDSSHVDNVLLEIDTTGLAPPPTPLTERQHPGARCLTRPVASHQIAFCQSSWLSVHAAARQAKRISPVVPVELLGQEFLEAC